MGKGTTFIGQPVLNQVVNLMSKDKINILADEKGTDRYTKHLDSYTHLVALRTAELGKYRTYPGRDDEKRNVTKYMPPKARP